MMLSRPWQRLHKAIARRATRNRSYAMSFDAVPDRVYALEGCCYSPARGDAKAGVAVVTFMDASGAEIPGPYPGLSHHERTGSYRYVAAGAPEAPASFTLRVTAPEGASRAQVVVRPWRKGPIVLPEDPIWRELGPAPAGQKQRVLDEPQASLSRAPQDGLQAGLEYVLSRHFQDKVLASTARWDKEWMRYFSIHHDYNFYFYDMSSDNYALTKSPREIEIFSNSEMYFTKLYRNMSCGIWTEGRHVVGKTLLEMGCGPGVLGRLAGRFANDYIGLDASQFALYIARLTSPKTCRYFHLSDANAIRSIRKSADICAGRNFFIHHNYDDSLWILCFLRDLTKKGGIISADFFCDLGSVDNERRRFATAPLHSNHPSALYHFSRQDIERISRDAGLECIAIDDLPDQQRRFATLMV